MVSLSGRDFQLGCVGSDPQLSSSGPLRARSVTLKMDEEKIESLVAMCACSKEDAVSAQNRAPIQIPTHQHTNQKLMMKRLQAKALRLRGGDVERAVRASPRARVEQRDSDPNPHHTGGAASRWRPSRRGCREESSGRRRFEGLEGCRRRDEVILFAALHSANRR